jgi:hypothetical protein
VARRGILIYIKPTLSGKEPSDLLQYARESAVSAAADGRPVLRRGAVGKLSMSGRVGGAGRSEWSVQGATIADLIADGRRRDFVTTA